VDHVVFPDFFDGRARRVGFGRHNVGQVSNLSKNENGLRNIG
jgi:hypothetical protein